MNALSASFGIVENISGYRGTKSYFFTEPPAGGFTGPPDGVFIRPGSGSALALTFNSSTGSPKPTGCISIFVVEPSGFFGSVTVKTPFLKVASIFSMATVSGTRNERSKAPTRRSRTWKPLLVPIPSSSLYPLIVRIPFERLTSIFFSSSPGISAVSSNPLSNSTRSIAGSATENLGDPKGSIVSEGVLEITGMGSAGSPQRRGPSPAKGNRMVARSPGPYESSKGVRLLQCQCSFLALPEIFHLLPSNPPRTDCSQIFRKNRF